MSRRPTSKKKAVILLSVLALGFILTQTPLGAFILASPWWVYGVVAGIIVSGYLAVKYTLEDQQHEQEWIETEGNVYMERLEKERQRRQMEQG